MESVPFMTWSELDCDEFTGKFKLICQSKASPPDVS